MRYGCGMKKEMWIISVSVASFLLGSSLAPAADESPIADIPDAVWTSMQGVSWHSALPCPTRDALRLVQIPFVTFSGERRAGPLIVDADLADEVLKIFTEIADDGRYRIERVQLIDAYGGDDFKSIEANNTSAFNCRLTTGAKTMSAHAKGRAIDINPLVNPYVNKKGTSHKKSIGFVTKQQRAKSDAPGIIKADGIVVKVFKKYGWTWGGDWRSIKDYQHFSKDGR
jgi:D-alanyl-D-alanine carboxypeptidase